jgi:hypothetical protein
MYANSTDVLQQTVEMNWSAPGNQKWLSKQMNLVAQQSIPRNIQFELIFLS